MNFNNKEINKQYLEELLNLTMHKTKGLTKFNDELLNERPESILIFRLLLKKSQNEFSKIINLSKGSLWRSELGESEIIRKHPEIIEKIRPLFKKFTLPKNPIEDISNTYLRFRRNYLVDSERAKEIRKNVSPFNNADKGIKSKSKDVPENDFELQISSLLKENNIEFDMHGIVNLNKRKIIVDFVIPSSKNPKIVVEVKQTATTKPRRVYDALHYQAIVINHRMRAIKKEFPETKTVAIISSKNIPIKKVSPFVEEEFLDTDAYFTDSTLNKFLEYVKKSK